MTDQFPLTPEDISKLRRRIIPILGFAVFATAIFAAIFSFVLTGFADGFGDEPFIFIVFGFFALIFAGVIGYQIWAVATDIKLGIKERISGEITDKRLDVHTSTTHHSSGRRSGTSTKTTRRYFIYIDGVEHTVDYRYYSQARVGEHVLMEIAPKSKTVLSFEATESAEEESPEEIEIDTKFLLKEFPEQRLTEEDIRVLNSKFMKELKSKLLFMSPFLFIIFGLVVNELTGLLIFLFPILIFPMYQGFVVMRKLGFYIRNKQYAHKQADPVLVTDKHTYTSNRSGNRQNIVTSSGSVSVEPRLYDQLEVGDKLILFKPKYGKQILSVMTMDQEEFYV
ncbi:MAG: hypothetical protein CMB80_16640 [Flammeovirgaceae bacterium]|nr:hypothetical protein [Flammeovirgaceae bacterium]